MESEALSDVCAGWDRASARAWCMLMRWRRMPGGSRSQRRGAQSSFAGGTPTAWLRTCVREVAMHALRAIHPTLGCTARR